MIAQGAEAIRHCESRLRELMAQASASGQYEAVATLMGWAKAVSAILETPGESSSTEQTTAIGSAMNSLTEGLPAPVASRSRKTKPTRPRYPRFGRYRSELVKIGWSKKEKKEYQHRAPRRVVDLLCARLSNFRGKDFTSDELLPLEGDDGQDIPSYQAYLCLAWFRDTGMIVKNGRHGYFVDDAVDLKASVDQHWQQLSRQR